MLDKLFPCFKKKKKLKELKDLRAVRDSKPKPKPKPKITPKPKPPPQIYPGKGPQTEYKCDFKWEQMSDGWKCFKPLFFKSTEKTPYKFINVELPKDLPAGSYAFEIAVKVKTGSQEPRGKVRQQFFYCNLNDKPKNLISFITTNQATLVTRSGFEGRFAEKKKINTKVRHRKNTEYSFTIYYGGKGELSFLAPETKEVSIPSMPVVLDPKKDFIHFGFGYKGERPDEPLQIDWSWEIERLELHT